MLSLLTTMLSLLVEIRVGAFLQPDYYLAQLTLYWRLHFWIFDFSLFDL